MFNMMTHLATAGWYYSSYACIMRYVQRKVYNLHGYNNYNTDSIQPQQSSANYCKSGKFRVENI